MWKFFWYVLYPTFAIPVLTSVAAVKLIFEPKPVYPPKHWAKEEAEIINSLSPKSRNREGST